MYQNTDPSCIRGMIVMSHPEPFRTEKFAPYQVGLLQNTNLGGVGFKVLKNQRSPYSGIETSGIPGHSSAISHWTSRKKLQNGSKKERTQKWDSDHRTLTPAHIAAQIVKIMTLIEKEMCK